MLSQIARGKGKKMPQAKNQQGDEFTVLKGERKFNIGATTNNYLQALTKQSKGKGNAATWGGEK